MDGALVASVRAVYETTFIVRREKGSFCSLRSTGEQEQNKFFTVCVKV